MKIIQGFVGSCVLAGLFLSGCGQGSQLPMPNGPQLFQSVPATHTGIHFVNELHESPDLNFYRYGYIYNGAGVAIGDVNNDGRADVYFTGNNVSDRLYLNMGNFEFKDISEAAGIAGFGGWKTGVVMADVNDDGLLDIHVCRSGWFEDPEIRRNLLFVNQGDSKFKEQAGRFGLDDAGHAIQSAFFDYDKDGDLDMYLANHPAEFKLPFEDRLQMMANPDDAVRDKLYRNNGDGTFTEISRTAGIVNYGHGLGLAVSDMNHDGWPDVYVANDFQSPDYYYVNNGDGTFTDQLETAFKHVSYFAMGSDVADIDNDGLLDLFVVEMLPEDNKRQKTNMAPMNPERFWHLIKTGFYYQFMRNTLQLNNGNGTFSDIAYLAGVANTDWSWAPLFADFDHDGDKDVVVTNGFLRDTQDKDYVNASNALAEKQQGKITFEQVRSMLPSTPVPNYAFRNNGDLTFSDVSEEWGVDFVGFSNGMAYGDLDLDGDLDLVVNNINDPALIYRNTTSDRANHHYLRIMFEGPPGNRRGLGTKITLKTSQGIQYQELMTVRGYQSCCEGAMHFGLNEIKTIDRIDVEWMDGRVQFIEKVPADQTLVVRHEDAQPTDLATKEAKAPLFNEVTARSGVNFKHEENEYDDYSKEILLPHKQSQNGPKIAVGDVNGDELEDFFVGGAAGQAGAIFLQTNDATFERSASDAFRTDAASEDIAALFLDIEADGDLDLYVVSGGNEFPIDSPLLQDRIYFNDGIGGFEKAPPDTLPQMPSSGGCVAASDFEGDGDLDLFVGGRILPGTYPRPPRSYLLLNENGKFTDATAARAPGLHSPGLVTSAIWTDFNSDKKPDLILVGEWMPVTVFENTGGHLQDVTDQFRLDRSTGWWNKIVESDLDDDGDLDYVIGNLGLNYKYKASEDEPFLVYSHDFDQNGSLDIVLGYYNKGVCFPLRGRQCSSDQIPVIKKRFPTYAEFGEATLTRVYGDGLDQALRYEATQFAHCWLENDGGTKLRMRELPIAAQTAPVQGIVCEDLNDDGFIDLLLAGNLYVAEVETGRADAGTGVFLSGNGRGGFERVAPTVSGFIASGDVRDIAILRTRLEKQPLILVSNNDDRMQVFRRSGSTIVH